MIVLISRLSLSELFDLTRSQEEMSLNCGHDSTKLSGIMYFICYAYLKIVD